jgi:hypothetical protein
MPKLELPLIKGDKVADNTDYRDALQVNMTAVSRPILGAEGYLLSHPGLTAFATGSGLDRGGIWNERLKEHYRVSGTKLISLDRTGVVTELGDISGTKRASVNAYSFNTQAIVADGKMWLYDGSTLTEITDPDLGTPIDICWIDGYYFMTDGEFLYHTLITDEYQIDPLQFATAEFSPDPTLAVDKTSDNQVIVFGRYSTEWFINRATDNFAFQRVASKAIKAGVVGIHCETELEGQFYILGGGKEESVSLHVVAAGQYKSIATREVDKVLSQYNEDELADSVLETRVEDRDKFIVVRLPNETLLFNLTIAERAGGEAAWTIVKTDVVGDTKWRGANGVFDPRIPSWIYGDNQDERIGLLDNTVSTQYGDAVEQIFYTPLVDLETASIDSFELDTLPGHQINADDVTCAFSLTYNGLTYGQEWWGLYGQQHNYGTRFIRNRLGYVRDNVGFKVRCASPERLAFSKMILKYG